VVSKNSRTELLEQYRDYIKKDPKLLRIMKQLQIDQESYLNALYQIESSRIIPEKIYTDTTFQE